MLSSRSLECHAANDKRFRFFPKDSRFTLLGLVKTVDLANAGVVFDGSERFVSQSDKFTLDICGQVFRDGLFGTLEHLHGDDVSACVLDAETTERFGDLGCG